MFVRGERSMILRDSEAGVIHPWAVNAVVAWPISEMERLSGLEEDHRDITISVQPELKLPSPAVPAKKCSWDQKDNGHAFWVIPRRKTQEEAPNCEITDQTTTIVVCTQPKPPLHKHAEAATVTCNVRLPHIVNTKTIEADEKVILDWAIKENRKP